MTDTAKVMLSNYALHLLGQKRDHATIGKNLMVASLFLGEYERPGRREARAFMKRHSSDFAAMNPRMNPKERLLDFMDYCGCGYGRKERKVRTLEKTSAMSERNAQTVNEYVTWLSEQKDYSLHTLSLYELGVRLFFEYSNTFNNEAVRQFVATLEAEGKKPATITARINALRSFAKFIGKPLAVKSSKVQRKLETENIPTEAEYNRLTSYLETHNRRWWLIIRTLATSGARCSEFLGLTWADVIHGEKTIKGKGGKYRRLFFPLRLSADAKAFVSECELSADEAIATNRYGTVYSERGLGVQMKVFGEAVKIDRCKMHPHAFRHFFAKKFLKANKNDIVALAEVMGHEKIDTTRIYLQMSYDEQKRNYNRTVTW